MTQWARRLRPRFQVGLLGLIRGERMEQNLEILAKVAEKLEQVATTQPVFQLWWVIGAVLEALRANGLEGSATLKRLLGQADRQIKLLYEVGEESYCEDPPLDLLNNLLYYVARATSSDGRIAAVRASFKLAETLYKATGGTADGATDGAAGTHAEGSTNGASAPQDDVIDAEFKEAK